MARSPLGDGRTYESSEIVRRAYLEMIEEARATDIAANRYSQGGITRVARDAIRTLLDPKHGFDHWSGTNDLAGSDLARRGCFSKRQWQRVKPGLVALGIIQPIRRSIKTGLPAVAGVDVDLPISDLYRLSVEKLVPWLRRIIDPIIARLAAELARDVAAGRRKLRELAQRKRQRCLIPAQLNPVGWARSIAALAAAHLTPAAAYAAEEARAIEFATRLAANGATG